MAKISKSVDFNKFMFNELKMQISTKDKAEITNLLNWSLSDFEKVKEGKKELSLKEIQLLQNKYNIDIDSIYHKHLNNTLDNNIDMKPFININKKY